MVNTIDSFFAIIFYPPAKMTIPRPKPKYKRLRRSWKWKLRTVQAFTILSLSTTTRYHTSVPTDTDSEAIGIDNRASACISHMADDFIGGLKATNHVIIGYNGSKTTNVQIGTLRWKWTDDMGVTHTHTIPNSFYSPDGGIRLLSPQHWAQAICKNHKVEHPPSSTTTAAHVILRWGNKKIPKDYTPGSAWQRSDDVLNSRIWQISCFCSHGGCNWQ